MSESDYPNIVLGKFKNWNKNGKHFSSRPKCYGFVLAHRKDVLFCIEFLEPVDLTVLEPEIVCQAFENERVWGTKSAPL